MKFRSALLFSAGLCAAPGVVSGQTASSTDYRLHSAAAANGGGGRAVSADYTLRTGTMEGSAAGRSTSAGYTVLHGWVPQTLPGSTCPAFSAWQVQKFGNATAAEAAPLADPDLDGLVNLLEFALNRDPLRGDSSGAFPGTVTGGTVQFTFTRAASCLLYSVETASAPQGPWQPPAAPWTMTVQPPAGGLESVTLSVPTASAARQFFRLRATFP